MADAAFDIFLSHNSRDKLAVEQIAIQLKQAGFTPWLDAWDLPAGGDWQDGIDLGLRHSRGCAVFLGPHGFGDWQLQEMKVAASVAAHDPTFRYFLVLLPGAPDPLDARTLPAFINLRGRINLRDGFGSPRQLRPLTNAILGVAMGPSVPVEPDIAESPYRGLEPFDAEHAENFFGRDGEIRKVLAKLNEFPFLAVIGPSGSGKSSLVLAGLIPALRGGRLEGSAAWPIVTMVPGAYPVESLAVALDTLDPQRSRNLLLEELRGSARALRLEASALLKNRPRHARLVLIVDQFEEIFTLCRDDAERETFLGLLLDAIAPEGQCLVIITMRADFYPRVTEYPALADLIENHQLLVGALTREGLTAAIEQPAFRKGLQFEPGLVSTILADAGGDAGALPLLQYALAELWKRQQGGLLTLEGYRASGGVGDAIATRANAVFDQLSPEQQSVARRVLLRLTQPGETTEDTRRRAELDELITGQSERPAIEAAVNALVAARLLIASRDDATGAAQIDVAHEALIRAWPRLRQWLDEDRQGLLIHRRLTEAAQEWQRASHDPDLLYRGSRLGDALGLAGLQPDALNDLERDFLAESDALRQRERAAAVEAAASRERLRRRILAGLSAFSAIALLLALLAGWQWREAGLQTTEAVRQSGIAEQQAAAASNAEATAQAEAARAESEAEIARAAQDEAQRQTTAAQQADTASLARLLAVQSANQAGEFDLQMLLAAESYKMQPQDVDTHRALFTALQEHPNLERVLYGVQDRILALELSPDDQFLLAGDARGAVHVWDPITGQTIREETSTGQPYIQSMAFRPMQEGSTSDQDPWQVAIGSETGVIQIWTIGPEALRLERQVQAEGIIYDLAFSHDGRLLAAGNADGTIAIWDAESGAIATPAWQAHQGRTSTLTFSPDDAYLVSGGYEDETAALWDAATGERAMLLIDDEGTVYDLLYTPDGRSLITAAGGQIIVWDATSYLPVRELEIVDPEASAAIGSALAISGDSAMLAAGDSQGMVRQWRLDTGLPWGAFDSGQSLTVGLALNQDGSFLATSGANRTVRLWSIDAYPNGMFRNANGHHGLPGAIAFSPDNETIATGDDQGAIFLWDSRTGQPLGDRLRAPDSSIWHLAFNHDGSLLASAGGDGSVQLWDPYTGRAVSAPLGGHALQAVYALAFSPDDRWLVTAGSYGMIQIWDVTADVPTGRQFFAPMESGSIYALAFSPTGDTLAAAEGSGQILLWDMESEDTTERRIRTGQDGVASICFVADDVLATGGGDGSIKFWNTSDDAEIGSPLTAHESIVSNLSCDPTRGLMLSTGTEGQIRMWEYGQQEPLAEWVANPGSDAVRRDAVLRPDGQALAYISTDFVEDTNVVVQPVLAGSQPFSFPIYANIVNGALDATGQFAAAISKDDWLRIWDTATKDLVGARHLPDEDGLTAVRFSPTGSEVATGSMSGAVHLWQSPTADPIGATMSGIESDAQSLAFNDRGTILAAGGFRGDLWLWDARTQQPIGESLTAEIPIANRSSILSLDFSPDDSLLAAGAGRNIVVWDIATQMTDEEYTSAHALGIYAVAFSPDGTLLASVDELGIIRLQDVVTRQDIGSPLVGALGNGNVLTFSPDGSLLAAGSTTGLIGVWDVRSRTLLGTISDTPGPSILALVFSEDGSTLTALDYQGNVMTWSLAPETWQARACTIANRNLTLAEWQRFIGDPSDPRRPYEKTCPDLPGPSDAAPGLAATPVAANPASPVSATPIA